MGGEKSASKLSHPKENTAVAPSIKDPVSAELDYNQQSVREIYDYIFQVENLR